MGKRKKTYVKVKGLNQERAINEIIKKIKIYNFSRLKHDESEFEVDYANHKTVSKMLNDAGLEVQTISHHGIFSFLKSILSSYGIITALILCCTFYFLQYNLILKTDVFGIDYKTGKEISKFVNSNIGTRVKNKINTNSIELLIKDNFEVVSSVSVAIIGQSLVININKAVKPEELEEGKAIYSNFDGLITDINLVQGTLAVDVGDVVKKGDVLVHPYIIDSQGEQRDVIPKAEIFADVWLSEEISHYDYYIKTERTGNKIERYEVYLSSLLIYSNKKEVNFEEFQVEESRECISKNNILPFYRKKIVYYETKTFEVSEDFSTVKEKIIEKARENVLIFLQENEIIKNENFTIREGAGCHYVQYMITVNRNIGG